MKLKWRLHDKLYLYWFCAGLMDTMNLLRTQIFNIGRDVLALWYL